MENLSLEFCDLLLFFFLFPLSVLAHFIPGLTWSITFFSFSLQRWRCWEEGGSQAEWRQGCRSVWDRSQAQCGLFLIILMENCWPFLSKSAGVAGWNKMHECRWHASLREKPLGDRVVSLLLAWVVGPASLVIRNQCRATQALCNFPLLSHHRPPRVLLHLMDGPLIWRVSTFSAAWKLKALQLSWYFCSTLDFCVCYVCMQEIYICLRKTLIQQDFQVPAVTASCSGY